MFGSAWPFYRYTINLFVRVETKMNPFARLRQVTVARSNCPDLLSCFSVSKTRYQLDSRSNAIPIRGDSFEKNLNEALLLKRWWYQQTPFLLLPGIYA